MREAAADPRCPVVLPADEGARGPGRRKAAAPRGGGSGDGAVGGARGGGGARIRRRRAASLPTTATRLPTGTAPPRRHRAVTQGAESGGVRRRGSLQRPREAVHRRRAGEAWRIQGGGGAGSARGGKRGLREEGEAAAAMDLV